MIQTSDLAKCGIRLLLLAWLTLGASPLRAANAATPLPGTPTPTEIEARIKQAQSRKGLDEAARTALIDDYRRAAAALDARPEVQLSGDEQSVVRALWEGSLDVDSLTRKAALKMATMNSLLIGLEMKRVVRMLPGRMVELAEGIKATSIQ